MSWDDLGTIVREAREDNAARARQAPRDCPNDGQPLQEAPDGTLRCAFDGWVWRGEPVTW